MTTVTLPIETARQLLISGRTTLGISDKTVDAVNELAAAIAAAEQRTYAVVVRGLTREQVRRRANRVKLPVRHNENGAESFDAAAASTLAAIDAGTYADPTAAKPEAAKPEAYSISRLGGRVEVARYDGPTRTVVASMQVDLPRSDIGRGIRTGIAEAAADRLRQQRDDLEAKLREAEQRADAAEDSAESIAKIAGGNAARADKAEAEVEAIKSLDLGTRAWYDAPRRLWSSVTDPGVIVTAPTAVELLAKVRGK